MSAVLTAAYVDELSEAGRAAGLDVLGVASAEPFDEARAAIEARKRAGQHAGMQFTFRAPERSTDPRRSLPDAQALVVGARRYPSTTSRRPAESPGPFGRVARYAADDEYEPLRAGLRAIADRLKVDGWRTRVLCDDNALVDRAAARRAGLGWFGKNANLLLPGQGSWFVLGSVLTDAPLPAATAEVDDGCGACRRCLDGCPTGAIVAPGVVDARRCLAWLVQAEGDFPAAHREALGDRIYGCDDCQEVCPPNRRLERDAPDGDTIVADGAWVDLVALLTAPDHELLERHGRWYVPRRDPRYLRRNALVALGNVGDARDPTVAAVLVRYRDGGDEMLARHAAWATERLGIDTVEVR
jgi:epoxyqueuosine reductase